MKKYLIIIISIILCFCNILVVHASQQKQLIARFMTIYSQSNLERSHNIKLAADAINGYILNENSQAAFNTMTGERTSERGYKVAKVIQNGEYIEGLGGGVCQVSTTLYNALLLADIEILEVHAHSLKPAYVPHSRDAMVSFYSHDLVFKNNKKFQIVIYAKAENGTITVDIYGVERAEGITFRTEVISQIPPPPPLVIDDIDGKYQDKVIFAEEKYTLVYPKNGCKSRLYVIRNNIETLVREDNYLPTQGVIVRGTV